MHITSLEQFWWGWEYSLDVKIVDCLYSSPTSFDTNRSFHYFVASERISLSSSALCLHMSCLALKSNLLDFRQSFFTLSSCATLSTLLIFSMPQFTYNMGF